MKTKTIVLGILICSIIYLLVDFLLYITDQKFPLGIKGLIGGFIGVYITSFFVRKRSKTK